MKITIEVDDSQIEQLAALIAAKLPMAATTEVKEEDDDLAGDEPVEEVKKVTLADVQDAIRRAGAVNKDKTKAVLIKYVPKGKEPRGTSLVEDKYEAVVAELAKIK